jgi:arylsulfatase A-like enzyme
VVADKALDFIRRHRQRPFFAYLLLTVPHGGFHVPEDSSRRLSRQIPRRYPPLSSENGRQAPQPEPPGPPSPAWSRLDGYAGRVLALLKELRLEENTIVFFTSDNGGIRFSDNFFSNTCPVPGPQGQSLRRRHPRPHDRPLGLAASPPPRQQLPRALAIRN